MEKPRRLAVRTIVEHVARCGDIDSRFADSDAMYEGARAHRAIQKSMGDGYQKEVTLQLETVMGDIPVVVHGRADGIITGEDGRVVIDEIKTTTLPLAAFYRQHPLHLAQAKLYARMLLPTLEQAPEEIGVQLTYFQLETGEIQRHHWSFSAEELIGFFNQMCGEYGKWMVFSRDWLQTRNASCKGLSFPFPAYRAGQRSLAAAVYRTVTGENKLYAQAPTGIGKTISALFPVIKAMGEGKGEKAFYLTAKTVTRAVAEDAVRLMAQKGLRLKSVTLRAKDKLCPQETVRCTPDHCPRARGHYDRINEGLMDILTACDLVTPVEISAWAEKHCLCPHELALDISSWSDVIIGDYNHVFDPGSYLRRFFSEEGGDYIFLIDEAHNLADRVRDMYTVEIRKSDFLRMKREITGGDKESEQLRLSLNAVNTHLLGVRKEIDAPVRVERDTDDTLGALLAQLTLAASDWLGQDKNSGHPAHGELLELFFSWRFFQEILDLFDSRFAAITECGGSEVTYTLFCLDPSQIIGERLALGRSAILFSATLTPLPYYRELLGGDADDDLLALDSPFDRDNLLLLAHAGISTKYRDRDRSYGPIAQAIADTVTSRAGNYMVYFPSYEYMNHVLGAFLALDTGIALTVQQRSMDESAREDFLAAFQAGGRDTLVGFCVLGGIFSEGIDLKGDRLIGTVVVGVGLPKITLRTNLIRDYFDEQNGYGYAYAYVYPGMNKVLQAAGRVIRTEEDRGAVVLIDSRFATREYRRLYPGHWSHIKLLQDTGGLRGLLEDFWSDSFD